VKPYYEADGITIYHGECLDVLPSLGRADLAVADPPYTFGLSSTAQASAKGGGWADLMNNALFYVAVMRELRRIVEPSGSAWVFNSWRSFPVLARASCDLQWPIESLLVWDKGPEVGMGGPRGLRATYEVVALFAAPGFRVANRSAKDIWNVPWGGSAPRSHHPAEKPVALLSRIIRESGARSLVDPFMGSGTSLVAAKQAGCRAVGIEMEERYCEIAATRLSQSVLDLGGVA
jgi:DNA modification methylase